MPIMESMQNIHNEIYLDLAFFDYANKYAFRSCEEAYHSINLLI